MKRKFYDAMLNWKRTSNGRTALMIDGARRVGKSYIAEEFAKREYDDFLLDKSTLTRRHNVSPVEVKSGSNVTHASLDKFRNKFKSNLAEAFLLSDRDVKVDRGITYLPLYMAPLLVRAAT